MNDNQKKSLSSRRSKAFSPRESEANSFLQEVLDQCDEWREYTHSFHTYPGRMHPQIARVILAKQKFEGALLDPFCGSGTTLVEGMLAGHRGLGNDIHPLAVRIARVKTSLWPEEGLKDFLTAAKGIGQNAHDKARVKGKSTNQRRVHPDEAKWFQPHIRFELSNLLEGISNVSYSRVQDALEIVLSSMLVKVSNQRSDSNLSMSKPNLSRGFTSRFFEKRAEELIGFLETFRDAVPENTSSPRVRVGDARDLHWVEDQSVGMVITSPPYPGTYDYFSHQALRTQILGIEDRSPRRNEMGSRSQGNQGRRTALERWEEDFRDVLNELARTCKPGANAFFVIGTSRIGGRFTENDKMITIWAKDHGFRTIGVASQTIEPVHEQPNPKKHQDNDLPRETLVWLQRDDRPFPEHLRRAPRGRKPKQYGKENDRGRRGGNDSPRGRDGRPFERNDRERGSRPYQKDSRPPKYKRNDRAEKADAKGKNERLNQDPWGKAKRKAGKKTDSADRRKSPKRSAGEERRKARPKDVTSSDLNSRKTQKDKQSRKASRKPRETPDREDS